MNYKVIFSVYGIYTIIMGLFFILLPATAMEGVHIEPTPDLIATQQVWGAALLGIGLIALTLRKADGVEALAGTAKAFALLCFIVVLITVYHMIKGYGGPPIYINIVVQLVTGTLILMTSRK